MTCLLVCYQEDDEYSSDYGTITLSHGLNAYRYSETTKAYWDESYGGWMIH